MKNKFFSIKCESCGAHLKVAANTEYADCEFCGAHFFIAREKTKAKPARRFELNPRILTLISLFLVAVIITAVTIGLINRDTPQEPYTPQSGLPFKHKDALLYEGTYLIGRDIAEGEYIVYSDPSVNSGRVLIKETENAKPSTSYILHDISFAGFRYIELQGGYYVEIRNANIFRTDAFNVEANSDGSYNPGHYKVGTLIGAGEYVLCGKDENLSFTVGSKANTGDIASLSSLDYRAYIV